MSLREDDGYGRDVMVLFQSLSVHSSCSQRYSSVRESLGVCEVYMTGNFHVPRIYSIVSMEQNGENA